MKLDELKINTKIRYIIIASAINVNIDDSKRNWDNSYYVNVVKTKSIIDYCFEHDIIPIYISSDGVFDGLKGGYKETDNKNPVNCYGRIRNEVEDHLLNSGNKFIILRSGRVFGTDLKDETIITDMIKQLREKKCIPCKGGVPPLTKEASLVYLKQLDNWNVKYHELRMGKPAYDLLIDDKALNSLYHFNMDNIKKII